MALIELNLGLLGGGGGPTSTNNPLICSPVHYVDDGKCRAGMVAELCTNVPSDGRDCISIAVLRPQPVQTTDIVPSNLGALYYYEHVRRNSSGNKVNGTWHWPETS